jgi:hypothetical protein
MAPDPLAVLYGALRKAQEDNKNEPDAGDFHYGEMEMRRRDRHTPWAERVVMWLYWLVSGDRLRGVRAPVWLAAVVIGRVFCKPLSLTAAIPDSGMPSSMRCRALSPSPASTRR